MKRLEGAYYFMDTNSIVEAIKSKVNVEEIKMGQIIKGKTKQHALYYPFELEEILTSKYGELDTLKIQAVSALLGYASSVGSKKVMFNTFLKKLNPSITITGCKKFITTHYLGKLKELGLITLSSPIRRATASTIISFNVDVYEKMVQELNEEVESVEEIEEMIEEEVVEVIEVESVEVEGKVTEIIEASSDTPSLYSLEGADVVPTDEELEALESLFDRKDIDRKLITKQSTYKKEDVLSGGITF